jgi:hypothetical protein
MRPGSVQTAKKASVPAKCAVQAAVKKLDRKA